MPARWPALRALRERRTLDALDHEYKRCPPSKTGIGSRFRTPRLMLTKAGFKDVEGPPSAACPA